MMTQQFLKKERLQHRNEFRAVFDRKWSVAGSCLIVYGFRNGLEWNRLGLSVGRRFGNAVHRNRFKRRCREVFRTTKPDQPIGWDWIIVPLMAKGKAKKVPQSRPSLQEIREDLLRLTRKIERRFAN